MPAVSVLRAQIETALSDRIPSALTPAPRIIRPVAATGICSVDELLAGGLPLGAITEIVGAECSGRTSFALAFIARMTQAARVCAWVDVSNALHPESAAAMNVDLSRLLWVRCGVSNSIPVQSPQVSFVLPEKYLTPPPVKKGLHGGGFGPHPRSEERGLADAVSGLFKGEITAPRYAEPQRKGREEREILRTSVAAGKPWSPLNQALRVTDLLLQGGGFSAIVLDMGSIGPEFASRVPLATWFRYRAAAEQSQTSIILLTQHPCAKSSAELVLRFRPGYALREETTVFTGIEHSIDVERERFAATSANVLPLRKLPQSARSASWQSRTTWAARK